MMFGEVPEHIRKRHAVETPKLGSLDSLVLPSPTIHYAEPEILPSSATRAAVLDSSAKLDSLTQKALDLFDEILSEPMSDDGKSLAVQMEAAKTILQTQLRVDDSRLKKRDGDRLGELLKRMDFEDDRLMKVVSPS